MLRVELHSHTIYSEDSLASLDSILKTCRRKGIQRIAITDHDTITGALRAKEMDPELVIVGQEIETTAGELLGYFLREEISRFLPPLEAIARVREQGGVVSAAHPFDRYRKGHWEISVLEEITPHLDAIETFNARCIHLEDNHLALEYARRHNLLATVGSDAHTTSEIGRASLLLPEFSDAASLLNALKQAIYQTRLSSPWIHLTSRYAKWLKKVSNPLRLN